MAPMPLRKYSLSGVEVFIVQENKGITIIKLLTLSPNSIVILFSIFQDVVCARYMGCVRMKMKCSIRVKSEKKM